MKRGTTGYTVRDHGGAADTQRAFEIERARVA